MRSDDGILRPFKPGIGLLAAQSGVPVVPVHIKGTDSVVAKGGSRPHRGHIEVTFGNPLRIPADTEYSEAADIVRDAIASLAQEDER
jgi:1-acyl-sn-glycerol-3-phosphate acyltransferase